MVTLNVTLLAAGSAIDGNLILDHGLSLFGIVDGNVITNDGLLHIGAGGLVKGRIEGEHVRVDATVEGDVHARGRNQRTREGQHLLLRHDPVRRARVD